MRTTVRRLLGAVLALGLAAGTLTGAATAASASTNPAHSLEAARAHAPLKTWTWVKDSLARSTQQNWYRIVLTRGGYLSVVLGDLPKDYNLALYDEAGTRLASSDHAGTRFEDVDRARTAAGTYFLRVASTSGSSTAEYALRVRLSVAPVGVLSARLSTDVAPGNVFGEFVNNTDQWIGVALSDVTYRRADGSVVLALKGVFTFGGDGFVLLPPRARRPFVADAQRLPAGVASVVVVPQYKTLVPRTPARITLTGVTRRYDAVHDRLLVTGTVHNLSGRRLPQAQILLPGYDRRGLLVALGNSTWRSIAAGAQTTMTADQGGYSILPKGISWAPRAVESTNEV